jgi:16S rRNA processing protein RimM
MGRIVGPFGVAGWLKVKPFCEDPDTLGDFDRWMVGSAHGWTEMALEDFELHSKGPVAKLAGCDDRNGAEAMRNRDVAVPRGELGQAGEGEYFQADLVGLDVVDGAGNRLGAVEGFFETGETSVMVVAGTKERLIPFVAEYVKDVDRGARRITVDWQADYDT